MNKSIYIPIFQFIVLITVQIFIFNNINLLGYINPYPYILFLLLFPFTANRSFYILIAFITGIVIDIFSDSGGIHAASCLTMAYLRPFALSISFGVSYEYNAIRLSNTSIYERLVYMTFMVLLHHSVLFSLEVFNIKNILYILEKTLYTSIFTILLCLIITILFAAKKQ